MNYYEVTAVMRKFKELSGIDEPESDDARVAADEKLRAEIDRLLLLVQAIKFVEVNGPSYIDYD